MTRNVRGPALGVALAFGILFPVPAGAATHAGPLLDLRTTGRLESDLKLGGSIGATLLQPGVGGWVDSENMALDAMYSMDIVAYPRAGDTPRVPTPNQRAHGSQMVAIDDKTTFHMGEIGEQVTDPTSLSRLGIARSYGETRWLSADASVDRQANHHLLLTVGYHGDVAAFNAPVLQDGMVNAPFAWARYSLSRNDTFGVRYKLQLFDDFGGAESTSHEPSLTWSHRLGRTVHLDVAGGPALLQLTKGNWTVVPQGEVSLRRQTDKVVLTLSYGRSLLGATGIPGPVWSDSLQGYANVHFTRRVSLHAGLGLYRNGTGPDGAFAVRGAAGEAALGYVLSPGIEAQLAWRLALQTPGADTNVEPIYRNIIAAGFDISFDGGRVPR